MPVFKKCYLLKCRLKSSKKNPFSSTSRLEIVCFVFSDPYVKIYLTYKGQRIAKKKTHVKKRTLNPVFNESFVFDIPNGTDELDNVSLEILLLDWDRVTRNEVCSQIAQPKKQTAKSLTS